MDRYVETYPFPSSICSTVRFASRVQGTAFKS